MRTSNALKMTIPDLVRKCKRDTLPPSSAPSPRHIFSSVSLFTLSSWLKRKHSLPYKSIATNGFSWRLMDDNIRSGYAGAPPLRRSPCGPSHDSRLDLLRRGYDYKNIYSLTKNSSTGSMRYLTRTYKKYIPSGGFQNQLEAHGDLAANAKRWRGKGCENLPGEEDSRDAMRMNELKPCQLLKASLIDEKVCYNVLASFVSPEVQKNGRKRS